MADQPYSDLQNRLTKLDAARLHGIEPRDGEALALDRPVHGLEDCQARLELVSRSLQDVLMCMDAVGDGIATTGAEDTFTYANKATAAVFGREVDDLLGQPWMNLFDARSSERLKTQAIPAVMRDGRWRGDVWGRLPDGTPIPIEVVLTAFSKERIGWQTRDISERLKRDQERLDLEMRLLKAEREAALFTVGSAVAHDFNNLLLAIGSQARLLCDEVPGPAQARLNAIVTAADRAVEVIRQFELDRTNNVQTLAPVDLTRLLSTVETIVASLRPAAAEVRLEVAEDAAHLSNEVLLCRALINVVYNAFEALEGPGEVTVRLARTRSQPLHPDAALFRLGPQAGDVPWVIEVTDNGCGIPPDRLEAIFSPFTSSKHRVGGGLGLSSLQAICDTGTITVEVESLPGFGSRFSLLCVTPAEDRLPAPNRLVQTSTPPSILLVEDNELVGEVLLETLLALGYEAVWLQDPRQAIDRISAPDTRIDLLLTDYNMPELRGDALAEAAKGLRPDLPVIMYSGQMAYVPRSHLYAATLRKPLLPSDLRDAIDGALQAGTAAEAAHDSA